VAFKVSAEDTAGLRTATIATVSFVVSGSNIAPKMALTANGADIVATKLTSAGTQGQGYPISYQTLNGILPIQDTDSDARFYAVTSISGGTLYKGSGTVEAQLNAPATSPDTSKNQLLGVGEQYLYIPEASKSGTDIEILRVRAWDGLNYSSEAIVRLDLNKVYSVPVLTSVNDFFGLNQDQVFTFTYDELRNKTNASNVDETSLNRIKFKITALNSGELKIAGTALALDEYLSAGETFTWKPALGAYGRLNGFSVVAFQDNAGTSDDKASVNALNVHFNVAKANATPTLAAGTPITGAFEDIPFNISYNMLAQSYPGADAEGSVLTYVIVSPLPPSAATYQKKSGATITNITALPVEIAPGESVIWTPAGNVSGSPVDVMTIKVKDSDGKLSDDARMVQVDVSPVNDVPVHTAQVSLSSISKNPPGGLQISFDTIKQKIQVFDQETAADNIQYRIESVNAGKLYTGNAIDASKLIDTALSMPLLSKTGTNTSLTWEPDNNSFGNFTIMTVRAFDGTDYASTAVPVTITVNPSNTAPILNAGFTSDGTGGTNASIQNGSAVVTYDTLLAKTQAADVDGNPLSFQISYLESGSLTVGGTTLSTVGAPATPPTVGPGGWLVWRPAANATGNSLPAFRVRASDGSATSTESLVSVKVTSVNQAPTLNTTTTFAAVRNTKLEKSFVELATALDVKDLEDVNPLTAASTRYNNVVIKVTDVLYGTLYVADSFDPSKVTNIGNGNNTIISSAAGTTKIFWEPPAEVTTGAPIEAFRVVVVDSSNNNGLTSPMTATVKASISGSNLPPALSMTSKTYTGGKQNSKYI
jgi:hypothetical protein